MTFRFFRHCLEKLVNNRKYLVNATSALATYKVQWKKYEVLNEVHLYIPAEY